MQSFCEDVGSSIMIVWIVLLLFGLSKDEWFEKESLLVWGEEGIVLVFVNVGGFFVAVVVVVVVVVVIVVAGVVVAVVDELVHWKMIDVHK